MWQGSMVAIVTPMHDDGAIDEKALRDLVNRHITAGTAGLIAVGTTGESATLSASEQLDVIRIVKDEAQGRVPVIAGTGTNATQVTIERTQKAKDLGVDACLIVTPYYNKPTQEGLFQHFKAIAQAVDIPLILYNVPARTACDLLPETVARLASIPNIIGIKEATGDVSRVKILRAACGKDFAIYSGEDLTGLALILQGANGVISVTANVAMQHMADVCQAALSGDAERARALNDALIPLHQSLFLESNPIPVKWALHQMGLIGPGLRLPLTPFAKVHHAALREALTTLDLL